MKGYVVRGKWEDGSDVYTFWWPAIKGVQWTTDRGALPKDATLHFAALDDAIAAMFKSSHLVDVRILAVAEDGTEKALPSYEEALAERDALLILLDRVDYDGKNLPGELREDIGKALDAARRAGWRRE